MGAAFAFRFQLRNEPIPGGATRLLCNANWCCVKTVDAAKPFDPQTWVNNRNARASLPDVLGEARFRAITMYSGTVTGDVVTQR